MTQRTRFDTSCAAWSLCAILVAVGGCGKKDSATDAPAASASASSMTVPVPSGSSTGGALQGSALEPGETLMGRLTREAKSRPAVKPSAEEVFAAFDKLGAPVPQKEQTLGKTYSASYCIGGYAADRSLAINVCEYPDEASAAAGRDLSKSAFRTMANRDVTVRRSTTLTIIQAKPDAATTAQKQRLVDAFSAM